MDAFVVFQRSKDSDVEAFPAMLPEGRLFDDLWADAKHLVEMEIGGPVTAEFNNVVGVVMAFPGRTKSDALEIGRGWRGLNRAPT